MRPARLRLPIACLMTCCQVIIRLCQQSIFAAFGQPRADSARFLRLNHHFLTREPPQAFADYQGASPLSFFMSHSVLLASLWSRHGRLIAPTDNANTGKPRRFWREGSIHDGHERTSRVAGLRRPLGDISSRLISRFQRFRRC